jgi:class 3 adenylate cyclase
VVSRVLTILLVDLKGFTPRVAASSRQEVRDLLARFRKPVIAAVGRSGGRIIKEIGDAFLVTFESPTNAVTAGVLLQKLFRDRNRGLGEDDRIDVRVAIHSGEIEEVPGDVLGDGVNVACRVEDVTEIGEVYFTEAVFMLMNRKEVPSCEVGERFLKGLSTPVRLYRVLQDPADERYRKLLAALPEEPLERPAHWGRWLLVAGLVLVVAAAAAAILLRKPDPEKRALAAASLLVGAGRPAEAVESLSAAFEGRVPPPEALTLIESAAGAALKERLAARDFAAARTLAAKWAARWPALRELPVTAALAESEPSAAAERYAEAVKVIRETIAKGFDSWRLHLALCRIYGHLDFAVEPPSRRSGIYMEAIDELEEAVALWPAGQPLPAELKEELWKRFAVQPRGNTAALEERGRRLCVLVGRHLWPEYRKQIVAGCASRDDALRLSSYEVLESAGALGEADLLAYHAANLTYRHWVKKQDEALAFLEARTVPAERARAVEALEAAAAELQPKNDSDSKATLEKVRAALTKMGSPAP